jgi:hypothetical protein
MVEGWLVGCVSRSIMEELAMKDPDNFGIPDGMSLVNGMGVR